MGVEIIVEEKPNKRMVGKEEARLQAQCVVQFAAKYPDKKAFLIATFQEVQSKIEGAQKQSLGLVRGVSDLILFGKKVCGIEMKFPGSSHKVQHLREQCEWLIKVPQRGYFCDSVDMFWEIVNGGTGIEPKKVLAYLNTVKEKSIIWDRNLFV